MDENPLTRSVVPWLWTHTDWKQTHTPPCVCVRVVNASVSMWNLKLVLFRVSVRAGASGWGSYHGRWGFEVFSHRRACLLRGWALERLNGLRYPPYSEDKLKWLRWTTSASSSCSLMWRVELFDFLLQVWHHTSASWGLIKSSSSLPPLAETVELRLCPRVTSHWGRSIRHGFSLDPWQMWWRWLWWLDSVTSSWSEQEMRSSFWKVVGVSSHFHLSKVCLSQLSLYLDIFWKQFSL